MVHRSNRLVVLACSLVLSAGCASSGAFRAGTQAEQIQDYDLAVVEFTKAVKAHPDDRNARQALDRSKIRAAQGHFTRGRRLQATGRLDEAVVELQLAAELNPGSGDIDDTLRSVRTQLRTKVAVAREGKTQLQTLIDRSRDLTAPGTELPADVRLPASLTFRDASSRDVFTAMARLSGLNVVFDPTFREQPLTIDLRNASLQDALASASQATRSFYRISQRTITVIPDTPAKRREYEEEIVQTFYLSNADLKETIDLLRIVVDSRRIAPVTATNALSIKDTPDRIAAAGKLISAIDKARPEVVIDVELLEVDRTRLREYGLQIASPGSPGINGQVDVNGDDGLTLRDLRNLTQSGINLTSLPGLFYRLLKGDTNTRTLANPQLRTSEGVAAQARFGERVPVPVTTFSPLATGGVSQQPITSFNYENIGVNIDITPRTHHDDEVSLALKIEVSSISGTGFGGLPTFGNRAISTVIRLKDGETNLLAGLIRDDERRVVEGVPGLSDLPLVGKLFAHSKRETQETDIILTLTPHIIRVLDLTEDDLRPFKVGGEGTGTVLDLPILAPELPGVPTQPGQQAPPPAQPRQNPAPNAPAPAQPLLPPPATPARP